MERIYKTIKSLLNYFIVSLRKIVFWNRNYGLKDHESLLPITVNKKQTEFNFSSASIVNSYNSNISSNWNTTNNKFNQTNLKTDQEEEPNYFENMVPNLKKQRKVLIQNNDFSNQSQNNHYQSDRLSFTPNFGNELGVLDDNEASGWENDADINLDVDDKIKKMRQAEIAKRIADHKRIKMEKELKKSKSNKSNFMATKIS